MAASQSGHTPGFPAILVNWPRRTTRTVIAFRCCREFCSGSAVRIDGMKHWQFSLAGLFLATSFTALCAGALRDSRALIPVAAASVAALIVVTIVLLAFAPSR